jgi:hypothetical protein
MISLPLEESGVAPRLAHIEAARRSTANSELAGRGQTGQGADGSAGVRGEMHYWVDERYSNKSLKNGWSHERSPGYSTQLESSSTNKSKRVTGVRVAMERGKREAGKPAATGWPSAFVVDQLWMILITDTRNRNGPS